ncbi:pilus assembly PilX family protein [Paludibacterium purpuratum]|uniref:Tfp pilus assembly protein PilX n=1 Tax=Paludibacterium purpuratum TaxID=1144873 RepID=A0A4R7B7J0_9NEIS|nr:hypothetical protein [Paludibacterium purpuratum]TDR80734.1 Tfp pilus assembly protein PilX [Paludibacterium purpuratum]
MMRGFSLPGLLLAMLLGCSCLLMALSRYEALRAGLQSLRRAADGQQAMRMALFQLARDLRSDGQAGCQSWPVEYVDDASVHLSWGSSAWQLVEVEQDGAGRLARLLFRRLSPDEGEPRTLLLSSCARLDRLQAGVDFTLHDAGEFGRLDLMPSGRPALGGQGGHHLPSLELGPLVVRRYRQAAGWLLRDEQPLLPLVGLRVASPADGLWRLELTPPGSATVPRQLAIARRQRGMAMVTVWVLMLAGLMLLSSGQRLLLDDGRQVLHERQWTQALFRAEFALRQAERQVWGLARAPGHADWFRPSCQHAAAPPNWRSGLCSPPRSGERQALPAWLRGTGDGVLSPCRLPVCRPVALPVWQVGRRPVGHGRVCRPDPKDGPIDPDPCYIVELLDQDYRGAGLYRITVRAWGRTVRSRVTLQSYYWAQGDGQRLSWRML